MHCGKKKARVVFFGPKLKRVGWVGAISDSFGTLSINLETVGFEGVIFSNGI